MTQPETSTLRVLKNNSVAGAAFLVADNLIVTCAHVINAAGKTKEDLVTLRLTNGELINAVVIPEFWRGANVEDVAILRNKESILEISPLVLGSSEGTKGHTFSTFGFPYPSQELTGRGEIVGYASLNGIKLIQLRSEQVTPGFSGAPVFDENTQRVVGMIVAITPPDEYKRQGTTAFAIPSETIREICPELQVSDICPYVGLDNFTDETAEFFFGRDTLTEKLLKVLRGGCRFLAVFGPSGSGKSSVVQAGLLPALKKGQVPGSQKWAQITMPRADNPFEQMKEAGLNLIDINQYLEFHPEFERVVLFIDQFEELFTVCPDDIRNHFVHDLMSALENSGLILILSMRDDFYSAFNAKAVPLAGSTHKMVVDISATLELAELKAIIERPATKVGLTLEEGLTERIIEDLTRNGEAPSSTLPLLEFALTQLWERRSDGILTHDSYQMIDGVAGSLTRWADDAFSHLSKEDQTLAEGLLTSLVYLGDEAQGLPDTRRRRSLAEFEEPTRRVIKYFADLRLLITSSATVELIHDTLLREWGRLKKWLDENRNFLTWRQKLVERYREWRENRGELLRGRELAVAQDFWSKRRADLDEPIESQKLEEYISSSGKQVRRTRWLIVTSVVFAFLILAVFGAIAWEQRNNALSSQLTSTAGLAAQIEAIANEKKALQTSQAESTRVANAQATAQVNATLASYNEQQANQQEILKISQKLSNDAKSNISRDYRFSLLLGVESVRLNNLQQDNALPPLLDKIPPGLIRTLDLSSGPVRKIIYTPKGNLMVTMSDIVNLWNTEDPLSPKPVVSWKSSSVSKPSDVMFSPDSNVLVIGYLDGHIEIWDVSTIDIRKIETPNEFSSQSLANVKIAISPDSKFLALAGNKSIKIWDISTPSLPQLKGRIAHPHGAQIPVDISYLSFAPNSTSPLLVSAGLDYYLSIWNLKYTFSPVKRDGPARPYDPEIPNIALSSKYLMIADKKSIRIFSYSNNGLTPVSVLNYASYNMGIVSNMVINPDNSRLYTTTQDGVIIEWDLSDSNNIEFIRMFDGLMNQVGSITFYPESKMNLLVVGGSGSESTITIWNWNLAQKNISTMWNGNILSDSDITGISYSPRLNILAQGDNAGSIVLWDVSDALAISPMPPKSINNPGSIRHIVFNPSENALLFLRDWSNGYSPTAYIRDFTNLGYSDYQELFQTNTPDIFVAGNEYILGGELVNGITSIFQMDVSKIRIIREIKTIGSTECPFKDTAFTRDGNLAAIVACNVQLWDFSHDNGPVLIQELNNSSDPAGVAFNAGGTLLVSANGNDSISIWRLAPNGEYEHISTIISAHTNGVTSVAISPDGKTLLSGGGDQNVILWNISDPKHPVQIATLGNHTYPILNGGMFFFADGKTAVSASKNELILWNVDQQSWSEKACNIAGRNFTQQEWDQFVGQSIPYHATCPELPIP